MEQRTLGVRVWRGGVDGALQRFEVPQRESQTVLDVVTWIQRHADPTLSYRFSCRVGMCGSCAMVVNGQPRWTCRTHVARLGDAELTIEPLRNLPIVKDLATDMAPFFDKWAEARGRFIPSPALRTPMENGFARVEPSSRERRAADAGIECIGCGVCYSACDTVTWNPAYLGPAALNRAWTLVNDQRDGAGAGRLAAVAGAGGCQACHSHQSCQELCPKALSPTASIAGLKRAMIQATLRGQI